MYELNKLYNLDCMEVMKNTPDKFFDLAIVDPPYGGAEQQNDSAIRGGGVLIGRLKSEDALADGLTSTISKVNHAYGGRFAKYQKTTGGTFDNASPERRGGAWAGKYGNDINHWDIAPPPEYFEELARVSKNQIIWGGNYFDLPPTRCFLIWEKLTISENFTMAMCEYAWTSFNENAKLFKYQPQDKARFHPTQKPVALYEWILSRYAKPGDKILDTHAGSASSLVACHNMGYDFLGCEIDAGYYQLANERLLAAQQQLTLF